MILRPFTKTVSVSRRMPGGTAAAGSSLIATCAHTKSFSAAVRIAFAGTRRAGDDFPRPGSVTLNRTSAGSSAARFHSLSCFFSSRLSLTPENSSAPHSVRSRSATLAGCGTRRVNSRIVANLTYKSLMMVPASSGATAVTRPFAPPSRVTRHIPASPSSPSVLVTMRSHAASALDPGSTPSDAYRLGLAPTRMWKKECRSHSTAARTCATTPLAISALRCSASASPRLDSIGSVPCTRPSYAAFVERCVMMTALPRSSNCGRPARPHICNTAPRSSSAYSPAPTYCLVPRITHRNAGRLTPIASVDVEHSTVRSRPRKSCSTRSRSGNSRALEWNPTPHATARASGLDATRLAASARRRRVASSRTYGFARAPHLSARDASSRAAFAAPSLELQNTSVGFPSKCDRTTSCRRSLSRRSNRKSFFAGSKASTAVSSVTGRYSSPNRRTPSGSGAPSHRPTSPRFDTVAEHAAKRTSRRGAWGGRRSGRALRVLSRETTASSAPPRSSPRRCTSSIITSATSPKKDIPPRSLFLRVTLSNFSGVVRMTSTSRSSDQDLTSASPVSSRHVTPKGAKRAIQSSFFSCTRAFRGAMYIALRSPGRCSNAPFARFTRSRSICTIASSRRTVLPLPVGAPERASRGENTAV